MTTKKHTLKVSILNEEYSIRSDTPPEHARAVAQYLDKAIRAVMSSGGVVETNRAVVLAALQITAELFEAKAAISSTNESIERISEYVRPLLPPSKRTPMSVATVPQTR
jgi:cell division protein ZapA (FtsZ GTPase activity inhibitor)